MRSTPISATGRKLLTWLAVLLALAAGEPHSAQTQTGSNAHRVILVAPEIADSRALAPALADLARYLGEMTGSTFAVSKAAGPAPAVTLALATSPLVGPTSAGRLAGQGREAFLIQTRADGMLITANDEAGLSHGIYHYLEGLGVRWLLPGDKWTEVPKRRDIRLAIDRVVAPAFNLRGYAGTGGFFSWMWGRRYKLSEQIEVRTKEWQRRLRYGGDHYSGRHVGEAFIQDPKITPILAANPSFLAKIGGAWSPLYKKDASGKDVLNITAQLNAGSPDAIKLFCDWTLARLRLARKQPDKMQHTVISVEPADGWSYADNYTELPGNGSGSDQSFHIANACARTVREAFPDASVIILAYAGHAAPPSFALEPNMIVQLAPYAFQNEPPERFIAAWKAKAPRLSLYDYWSIPDWTNEEPRFNFLEIATKLRYWRAANIKGVQAESSHGLGAMGLGHYIASHVMWQPDINEKALIEDWLDKAFGRGKAPMKRMLERWATSFRPTSAELGASYRDLTAALRLTAGEPRVTARLIDYGRYLHYLRLRLELEVAGNEAPRSEMAVALASYLLSINDTLMVHGTRMIDLMNRRYPAIGKTFELAATGTEGPGWAGVRAPSDADVTALIADGVRRYPPPDFETRQFSGPLTPVRPLRWATPSPADPWGPVMPVVGDLELNVIVPDGLKRLGLRVTRQVAMDIAIDHPIGQPVSNVKITPVPDGQRVWQELYFDVEPGPYRITFRPAGSRASGYFSFQTLKGLPLTLTNFLSPKQSPSPRLYFWVPRGLKQLVMYYPESDYGGVYKPQVLDPTGAPVRIEHRDGRRLMLIVIPSGQDAAEWSLVRSVSPAEPHLMLNAPQAFALEPGTLMVPAEALR